MTVMSLRNGMKYHLQRCRSCKIGVKWVYILLSLDLVGNVVDISATCHPDLCRSHIFDDIFNVTDTVTRSQSWSRVGEIPRHDICEASTKLVCRRMTSSSVTRDTVTLPTHQQTKLMTCHNIGDGDKTCLQKWGLADTTRHRHFQLSPWRQLRFFDGECMLGTWRVL